MPCGILRTMGPVVSMALLMPPVPASAQGAEAGRPLRSQIVAEVAGSFFIRAAGAVSTQTPQAPVQLGKSIRLDRTLLRRAAASRFKAKKGGIHETR